jgi:hypothetical protein
VREDVVAACQGAYPEQASTFFADSPRIARRHRLLMLTCCFLS